MDCEGVRDNLLAYLDGEGRTLRSEFPDVTSYTQSFSITDNTVESFRDFAKARDVEVDGEQFLKDIEFIRTRLKAQIAQSLFNDEGWFRVMLPSDTQVKRALELLPQAEEMATVGFSPESGNKN